MKITDYFEFLIQRDPFNMDVTYYPSIPVEELVGVQGVWIGFTSICTKAAFNPIHRISFKDHYIEIIDDKLVCPSDSAPPITGITWEFNDRKRSWSALLHNQVQVRAFLTR